MKLYLSSYRIPTPNEAISLISKKPEETKLALIPNAKDYYAELARSVKIKETTRDLKNLGFKLEIVDLRQLKSGEETRDTLSDFDAIFVAGGNTFCLMHEIKRSGFDESINELLKNGLVYIGESAGAVVAGKTLKGVELADNPEFAESTTWEGLSLVPKIIWPHADNIQFAAATNVAKEMYQNNPELILLNDNQALLVDDSKQKIVTAKPQSITAD